MTLLLPQKVIKPNSAFGFVDGVDYLLLKVSEQVKQGVDFTLAKVSEPVKQGVDFELRKVSELKVIKNVYHFTPYAFKKILLSARPHARHEINVDRYRDYYLFLEEVVGYYNEYQQLHKDCRNAMLTDENKTLFQKIDEQIAKIDKQTAKIDEQSTDINELKQMNNQLMIYTVDCNRKIDSIFDFIRRLAKMALPMWSGSRIVIFYDNRGILGLSGLSVK